MLLSIGLVNENDLIGEDVVYVSADEPEIELSALLVGYSAFDEKIRKEIPSRIRWRVKSGSASVETSVAELDETGAAKTKVKLVPRSNNLVTIEALLIGDDAVTATSFEIGVVPGKPERISLSQSGSAYLKGIGKVEVIATITDKNGNKVSNGTGVAFRESGHINLESYSGLTKDGVIKAVFTGGSVAGSFPVSVSAGNAKASANISVNSLDADIIGLPTNLIAGQKYDLTARISGATGEALNNIFVDIGVDAGSITSRSPNTNSAGEVAFTYKAPHQAGTYTLAAKLDVNQPELFSLNVVNPANAGQLQSEQYYAVSGTGGEDHVSVANYKGQSASFNQRISNTLTFLGTPGDGWSISLDDLHLINREPVYFSRFYTLG